jgi:hypothetical protein
MYMSNASGFLFADCFIRSSSISYALSDRNVSRFRNLYPGRMADCVFYSSKRMMLKYASHWDLPWVPLSGLVGVVGERGKKIEDELVGGVFVP